MFHPRKGESLSEGGIQALQCLHRSYKHFILLAALLSAFSLSTLRFSEFHPTSSRLGHISEGLLCSSAITAVTSVMEATMLSFYYEDVKNAYTWDLVLAWLPPVFLNISITEFMIGLGCWYSGKNETWRRGLMGAQLVTLGVVSLLMALWILTSTDQKADVDGFKGGNASAHQQGAKGRME